MLVQAITTLLSGPSAASAVDDPVHRRPRDHRPVFRGRHGHRLLPQELHQDRRRLLPRRPRNDRLDRRPLLPRRQPRLPRTHGLGRLRLPIRHPRRPLVLDRRHPRHALPRDRDDPVLLHLQNPLRPRLPQIALRRTRPRTLRHLLRPHDRLHERHQYVLHGAGHEGRAGLGHPRLHLDLLAHRDALRRPGRPAFRHLQ